MFGIILFDNEIDYVLLDHGSIYQDLFQVHNGMLFDTKEEASNYVEYLKMPTFNFNKAKSTANWEVDTETSLIPNTTTHILSAKNLSSLKNSVNAFIVRKLSAYIEAEFDKNKILFDETKIKFINENISHYCTYNDYKLSIEPGNSMSSLTISQIKDGHKNILASYSVINA